MRVKTRRFDILEAEMTADLTPTTRIPLGWVMAMMGSVISLTIVLFGLAINSLDRVDSKYLSATVADARFGELRALLEGRIGVLDAKLQALTDEVRAMNAKR